MTINVSFSVQSTGAYLVLQLSLKTLEEDRNAGGEELCRHLKVPLQRTQVNLTSSSSIEQMTGVDSLPGEIKTGNRG